MLRAPFASRRTTLRAVGSSAMCVAPSCRQAPASSTTPPPPPAADAADEEDFSVELPGAKPSASTPTTAATPRRSAAASKPADPTKARTTAGLGSFFDDGTVKAETPKPIPSPFMKKWKQPAKVRPGSGAHHRDSMKVPDRLRDALTYFGSDAQKFPTDEMSNAPKESRDHMMRNVMGSNTNMYSHASIDKVRLAIEDARRKSYDSDEWRVVWSFLRTMHFMTEVVREPYDQFPEGDRLYIDLDACEDRRRPYFLQLEDGTLVLPVFSGEEYVGNYFQRLNIFESQWFPTPRMGKLWDGYTKQDFPVVAHGGLHRMASLATVATPHQVLLCINPTQPACKFLTYPEMVSLGEASKKNTAKLKPEHIDSALNPNRGGLHERVQLATDKDAKYSYSPTLHRIFDSAKWVGKRVDPLYIPAPDPKVYEGGILVPQIARDELKILVFDVLEIVRIYLADRPGAEPGAPSRRVAVAVVDGAESLMRRGETVRQRMSEWSYLKESEQPIAMEVVSSEPKEAEGAATNEIYNAASSELLRDSLVHVRLTIREQLGYDDVL